METEIASEVPANDAGVDWARILGGTALVAGHAAGYLARTILTGLFLVGRWTTPRQEPRHDDVPTPPLSLALAGKVALDEIGYASEVLSLDFRALTQRSRISAEAQAAMKLYAREGWLSEPHAYHLTPPPPSAVELEVRRFVGMPYGQLSYESGYAPHVEEPGGDRWREYGANQTAHAWLFQHFDRPRPWIVCVPGYRMGMPISDFAGFRVQHLYQDLGLNVAIPVLPLHGPRTVGLRSGDGFLIGDHLDTVHAVAHAVWDIRRLIAWIRQQDAPAVGIYGVSLGGLVASLIASLESDLRLTIAGVPPVDLARLTRWHIPPVVLRMSEYAGMAWDDLGQLLRVISPLAMKPRLERDRLFLFGALCDSLIPPDHVRDLWRHWQQPRIHWYAGSHISFVWDKEVRNFIDAALLDAGLTAARTFPLPDLTDPEIGHA